MGGTPSHAASKLVLEANRGPRDLCKVCTPTCARFAHQVLSLVYVSLTRLTREHFVLGRLPRHEDRPVPDCNAGQAFSDQLQKPTALEG